MIIMIIGLNVENIPKVSNNMGCLYIPLCEGTLWVVRQLYQSQRAPS